MSLADWHDARRAVRQPGARLAPLSWRVCISIILVSMLLGAILMGGMFAVADLTLTKKTASRVAGSDQTDGSRPDALFRLPNFTNPPCTVNMTNQTHCEGIRLVVANDRWHVIYCDPAGRNRAAQGGDELSRGRP